MKILNFITLFFIGCSTLVHAEGLTINQTSSFLGIVAVLVFITSYIFVILEEKLHLKKSKPVVLAASIIWVLVAISSSYQDQSKLASQAVKHAFLEYAELFLFLLVAMTYINALEERNIFAKVKEWIINKNFSFIQCFWVTGIFAFFISPIADNLTTALLMGAVLISIGEGRKDFILLGLINIVIAANAGGAFSPFGDITTLMVWQKGVVPFETFFKLFIPSLVNFVVPAIIFSFFVPKGKPTASLEKIEIKTGGIFISFLFLITIATAVTFENFLSLNATVGMMAGLGYLLITSHFINLNQIKKGLSKFNIFDKVKLAEWDTLLFFYGIILSVAGLSLFGYLNLVSDTIYTSNGTMSIYTQHLIANFFVGIISAIVDNIPVMFSILTMLPDMTQGQWLLATLTAGVGGSLLSVGSAAGVALMGQSKGLYTFKGHLKWSWVIFIGYVASVMTHVLINDHLF